MTAIFSFDVESLGLHGDGWAVGGLLEIDDKITKEFVFAVDRAIATTPDTANEETARLWLKENVPHLPLTHETLPELRSAFWEILQDAIKQGALIISDCGWPVEANFLTACIRDNFEIRRWEGPYPLLDVAPLIVSRGKNPIETTPRKISELPFHHPLCDARKALRDWHENNDQNDL